MKTQNIFKAAAVVAIVASLAMNAYLFTEVKEVKKANEHLNYILSGTLDIQSEILGDVIVLKMHTGISVLDEGKEASGDEE
jgi:hypothetical protein